MALQDSALALAVYLRTQEDTIGMFQSPHGPLMVVINYEVMPLLQAVESDLGISQAEPGPFPAGGKLAESAVKPLLWRDLEAQRYEGEEVREEKHHSKKKKN